MNPSCAHLVGSLPLQDSSQVFRMVAEQLATQVHRLPDGETGDRSNWIQRQFEKLAASPQLSVVEVASGNGQTLSQLKISDDTEVGEPEIPNLGYRDAALDHLANGH